jgi:hypothetical protein
MPSEIWGEASIVTLCCHTQVSHMAYVIRRGAFYYLNLHLPKHLFPSCHTLRLSLNIRERQAAMFLASSLAQQVHGHLSKFPTADAVTLPSLCNGWRDNSPHLILLTRTSGASTTPTARAKAEPTLMELTKKYIDEGKAGGIWREVSTHEVERSLRDLFELMGDMPVQSFDTHACSKTV